MDTFESFARNVSLPKADYIDQIGTVVAAALPIESLPESLGLELQQFGADHYEGTVKRHIQTLRNIYTPEEMQVLTDMHAQYPWMADKGRQVVNQSMADEQSNAVGGDIMAVIMKFMEEHPEEAEKMAAYAESFLGGEFDTPEDENPEN